MKPEGYYTSGEFAKMAHITIRTIRYYDKENILKPSYVNESGARFYTDEDFAKLQQILLLKYLGFSLDDIKTMTIGDSDHHMLRNSLKLQQKLVRDRIEQMEMVSKAIEETTDAIDSGNNIDWDQMLNLIHLTNMENTLKTQYENSSNISARINLHSLYSTNKQGWFPWIFEQCRITNGMHILEIGCGSGSLWKENYKELIAITSSDRKPLEKNTKSNKGLKKSDHNYDINITLNDISEGMLRDTKRELENLYGDNDVIINYYSETADTLNTHSDSDDIDRQCGIHFNLHAFDCNQIPYKDNSFDLIIANHVLFYCSDIDVVLSEIKRVLKTGGTFICSTYGASHMKEITELVQKFNSSIILSADKLYNRFGLDNGTSMLAPYFSSVSRKIYEDELIVDKAEPLIEYILSCHGNQNQYLLDRYKDFRSFVEQKTKRGFHITKNSGIFVCIK